MSYINLIFFVYAVLSFFLLVTEISFDVIFILAGQAHHGTQWGRGAETSRGREVSQEHEDDCSSGTNQGPTVTL